MAVNDRMLLLIIVLFQLIIYWTNAATINDDIINMIDQSIARSNQQKGDSLINQRTELRNITRKLWAAHDTKAERVGGDTNHAIAGDLKDIKRRLRAHNLVADYYNYLGENDETGSYFDDEIEYFTDEILDEWIDNLTYDEAMYVYNVVNNDESRYSDSYYDEYYSRAAEQDFILKMSSRKKGKIKNFQKYCKADATLERFGQVFKKEQKIKICKPAPSVMSIATDRKYTPRFSPGKEYKIKGLAYKCKSPTNTEDPNQYYIRFTDQKKNNPQTTHLISVKEFRKLISGSGKMQFGNGNIIKKTNTNAATPPIPNPPSATKPPTPAPADLKKRCVALSGGGIRAAMGSFLFLNKLESLGKLDKVKCISAISGGTWGLIMWLFKNKHAEDHPINGYPWGPTATLTDVFTPYEKWSAEIKKHIFDITSLKNQQGPILLNKVEEQLKVKFPKGMTVYFVADSVDTKSKRIYWNQNKVAKLFGIRPKTSTRTKDGLGGDYLTDVLEQCWFVLSTGTTQNYFTCSTDTNQYNLKKAVMKTNEGKYRKVELLDVLTFCSAAWAMEKAHSQMRKFSLRPTTDIFRIYTDANWDGNVANIVAGMDYKPWRLIDAGGTLNIPVIPYLTNDMYKMQNGYEIWVIEMSKWRNKLTDKDIKKKKKRGIPTKQMEKNLEDVMSLVDCSDSKLVRYDTCNGEQARDGASGCDLTIFTYVYDNRKIKLLPLYGKTKKWELIDQYPTKKGSPIPKVVQWNNDQTAKFIDEWGGHLENLNLKESF